MKILTLSEFWDLVEDPEQPAWNDAVSNLARRVAERADYVCVYRNDDLGDPRCGEIQCITYGSEPCQLEGAIWGVPPQTLPDIGNRINWRFQLVGAFAPGSVAPAEVIEADIVRLYGKDA